MYANHASFRFFITETKDHPFAHYALKVDEKEMSINIVHRINDDYSRSFVLKKDGNKYLIQRPYTKEGDILIDEQWLVDEETFRNHLKRDLQKDYVLKKFWVFVEKTKAFTIEENPLEVFSQVDHGLEVMGLTEYKENIWPKRYTSFGYNEKKKLFVIDEPAERAVGRTIIYETAIKSKYRWFVLKTMAEGYYRKEVSKQEEELKKQWYCVRHVDFKTKEETFTYHQDYQYYGFWDSRKALFEKTIQLLCKVYALDDNYMQTYINDAIKSLRNRPLKEMNTIKWEFDVQTKTFFDPLKDINVKIDMPYKSREEVESKQIYIVGNKGEHGDVISIGRVLTGPQQGRYYFVYTNDGFPHPMAGGGFSHLLPESVIKDKKILKADLFVCIKRVSIHAMSIDLNDSTVIDLAQIDD